MKTYTVRDLTGYIRNMFTQDFVLKKVSVCGEISNCKYHQTGHIYFTLKDEYASISCTCFKSDASKLTFRLEDGQMVEIDGRVDVYEKGGNYCLYARDIRRSGAGELYLRYEALKKELEERGMFAEEYKAPLPRYISTLGVVTAPRGAAVRDIINVTRRRNPGVRIVLYPALVQGDGAAASIAAGLKCLEDMGVDVIICGRGGGSIEDLWAFNEEIVAQAIFDCRIPVISAVGHETDVTIADFVADRRAPTPSAAAEMAVYEASRIKEEYEDLRSNLVSAMYELVRQGKVRTEHAGLRLQALSPASRMLQKRTYLMSLEDRLTSGMKGILDDRRHALQMYIARMKGLSPLEKLSGGYSITVTSDGRRISSVHDVKPDDSVRVYVSDGYLQAHVTGVTEDMSRQESMDGTD